MATTIIIKISRISSLIVMNFYFADKNPTSTVRFFLYGSDQVLSIFNWIFVQITSKRTSQLVLILLEQHSTKRCVRLQSVKNEPDDLPPICSRSSYAGSTLPTAISATEIVNQIFQQQTLKRKDIQGVHKKKITAWSWNYRMKRCDTYIVQMMQSSISIGSKFLANFYPHLFICVVFFFIIAFLTSMRWI